MADVDGVLVLEDTGDVGGDVGGQYVDGFLADSSAGVPVGPRYRYHMRAWNTVTVAWEFWTSIDSPSVSPPSGDPVTDVTRTGRTVE